MGASGRWGHGVIQREGKTYEPQVRQETGQRAAGTCGIVCTPETVWREQMGHTKYPSTPEASALSWHVQDV
jgi:hypothetical protein